MIPHKTVLMNKRHKCYAFKRCFHIIDIPNILKLKKDEAFTTIHKLSEWFVFPTIQKMASYFFYFIMEVQGKFSDSLHLLCKEFTSIRYATTTIC